MTNVNSPSVIEPEKSSLPDQVYTGTIITLGLLLLGLALFRPRGATYSTEAIVAYQRLDKQTNKEELQAQFSEEIRSLECLGMAIGGIPEEVRPPLESSQWTSLTEQVSDALRVRVDAVMEQPSYNVVIQASGIHEAFQCQLLSRLQKQFVNSHQQQVDLAAAEAEYANVQQQVAIALEQLDHSQQELDQFVATRLESLRSAHQLELDDYLERRQTEDPDADQPDISRSSDMDRLAVVETLNPAWKRIQQELSRLKLRRRRLTKADESASEVETLDETIRKLESELNATSKLTETTIETVQNPFVVAVTSTKAAVPHVFADSTAAEISDIPRFDEFDAREAVLRELKCQTLTQRVEQDQRNHLAALDALRKKTKPSTLVIESATVVGQPRVTSRLGEPLTASRFLGVLGPSLLLGLVCAWFRSESDPPSEFISPQDVAEWLDVPVTGVVSTDDGPIIPAQQPSQPTEPIRWFRRTAEIVVCVALVIVVLSLASDSGFKRLLIQDPFTAYTQAIDNVSRWFS